jgi:hypothetical protein
MIYRDAIKLKRKERSLHLVIVVILLVCVCIILVIKKKKEKKVCKILYFYIQGSCKSESEQIRVHFPLFHGFRIESTMMSAITRSNIMEIIMHFLDFFCKLFAVWREAVPVLT